MKKIGKFIKQNIIGIIIGGLIFGSTAYAEVLYRSEGVLYSNKNSGLTSTNVQDALDELYAMASRKNGGIDLKDIEFKKGSSFVYKDLEWIVVSKNNDEITLILKNSYKTGKYGTNSTFDNSVAYQVLNVDFLNDNPKLKESIKNNNLKKNSDGSYIRLIKKEELGTELAPGDGNLFWTMSSYNDTNVYYGDLSGKQGKVYVFGSARNVYEGRSSSPVTLYQSVNNVDYVSVSATNANYSASSFTRYYGTGTSFCGNSVCTTCYAGGWGSSTGTGTVTSDCTQFTGYNASNANIGYRPVITIVLS